MLRQMKRTFELSLERSRVMFVCSPAFVPPGRTQRDAETLAAVPAVCVCCGCSYEMGSWSHA
uniref:Uncharacterized protein n=1 Tax=Anguilla anguilla TaxID=7936 RepID=A0A0E9QG90_ANGAN